MAGDTLDYRSAGVDLEEARRSLEAIKQSVRSTFTPDVASDVGSFGGMFLPRFGGMVEPILVSSIDGVGTKTAVAAEAGSYRGLGLDIVNHCVNDILVQGAKPLFFLDYFGTSRLDADVLAAIVDGAAEACRSAGCALLGGETAELPGVYASGEFDVVGAITGVVDRAKVLPSPNIGAGDLVVGIGSNGLHTNGFSLARKALFDKARKSVSDAVPWLNETLGDALLRPHRSYLNALMPLLEEGGLIRGLAHITGGGLVDNVPRVLPEDIGVVFERRSWELPPLFKLIQESGAIADDEMLRVFNMGVGMCVICASERASIVVDRLSDAGETAMVIGETVRGKREVSFI